MNIIVKGRIHCATAIPVSETVLHQITITQAAQHIRIASARLGHTHILLAAAIDQKMNIGPFGGVNVKLC